MRKFSRRRTILLLASFALLIASCRLPGGQSPPRRYWVLEPAAGEAGNEIGDTRVEVGPFAFPGYLKRTEYVERIGERQLRVSKGDRWGEPLDRAFAGVMARNLEQGVPGVVAFEHGARRSQPLDLWLTGSVARFEVVEGPGKDREALLEATWTLTRVADDDVVVARGRGAHRVAVESAGADAGVAALSACLASLSREVAEALRELEKESSEGL